MSDPATTPDTTGSEYVLEALREEGVSTLFGFIGEGNAHLIDRTADSTIEFRYARHEQAAVTMADGYARMTGDVGVCTLTHGPGVTNAATGVASADRDNVPLVILVGTAAIDGWETSLQYVDHRTFTRPISVYQTRIVTTGMLPETLARAFDTARTDGGPVVVELPQDVQTSPAPEDPYRAVNRARQRVHPDPDRLGEAVGLLDTAEDPLLLAGGGAMQSGAAASLEALAERLGAPIATTFYGKGILPESHPLVSGIAGTFMTPANDELVWDVDVVVAVGAQLSGKTTRYGAMYADADVIQIDIDPAAIGTHRDPTVKLVGDANATLAALAERVDGDPERAAAVRDSIAAADEPAAVDFVSAPGRVDPRAVVALLSDRLPEDTVVTVDSGNNTGFPALFHRIDGDGRLLVNGNFGAMGYALPAALGAQYADPDRPVVCYIGDGAFLQVLQEVETAVRLDLPIVVVILNDASYGIIRLRQALEFDRTTASTYDSPDFAAVANGLGARAATVTSIDELDVVEEFLAGAPDTPLVVDVRTIPDVARPGFPPY